MKNLFSFHRNVLLLTLLTAVATTIFAQEDYTEWGKSKDLIINTASDGYGIDEDISDFPYLVRLFDDFAFAEAKANGEDIRFAKADGTTPLSYEIDSWDATAKEASIWVKVDEIKASNNSQKIVMYWGKSDATDKSNGEAVFGDGFEAVWHLSGLEDATSNGNDGTNNMTEENPGVVGNARMFHGSATINFGQVSNIKSLTTDLNISAWVKSDFAITEKYISVIRHDGHFSAMQAWGGNDSTACGYFLQENIARNPPYSIVIAITNLFNGKWHYYSASYNSTTGLEIFVDGVQINPATGVEFGTLVTSGTNPFMLGGTSAGGEFYTGLIDEVVVSSVVHNAAWHKLAYLNQKQVITAAPTLAYAEDTYSFGFGDDINITPSLGGVVEDLSISPTTLPLYLQFNSGSGAITGLADDPCNQEYIVTASNSIGSVTDTFTLLIGTNPIVNGPGKINEQTPYITGINNSNKTIISFVVPSANKISGIDFKLFSLKGELIWSSALENKHLKEGVNSIKIHNKNKKLSPGMCILEMSSKTNKSSSSTVQRMKVPLVK